MRVLKYTFMFVMSILCGSFAGLTLDIMGISDWIVNISSATISGAILVIIYDFLDIKETHKGREN